MISFRIVKNKMGNALREDRTHDLLMAHIADNYETDVLTN